MNICKYLFTYKMLFGIIYNPSEIALKPLVKVNICMCLIFKISILRQLVRTVSKQKIKPKLPSMFMILDRLIRKFKYLASAGRFNKPYSL